VTPKTLVWKLAALVLFAATGCDQEHPSHTFNTAELPLLFEQVIEQLQKFPSVPDDYRPQKEEPVFESQKRVRIMIGLSGAGKTTWAAQVARHSTAPAVYFDAGDTPPSAVASSLARELSARFLSKRVGAVGSVILPASSGMEMLRALDRRIEETPAPVVVIDNAHRVVSRHLCEIAEACSHFRFILLAQPWPALTETEALFEEEGEWLNGWDADTVAAEFHDRGCRIDPPTAERWRITTAGMPFFVRNAARLTVKLSGGDSARFLKEIDREAHTTATAQELVLSRVVDVLDQDAKTALAILSLCAAPLSREEVDVLLRALPALTDKAWGRALRQLSAYGILQSFSDGRLKVHNAMGIPARSLQSDLPPGTLLAGQTALRGLLLESFRKAFDFTRFSVWLRLLPATGGLEELVGIATEEFSMRLATRLI
jgi:hypothetical protein